MPLLDLDTFDVIRERDVDLALLIALQASSAVRRAVFAAVGLDELPLHAVRNSVSVDGGREADLVLESSLFGIDVRIEIENKIDACFQPNQAEDYGARSAAEGEGAVHRCLLFAPERYLDWARETGRHFDGRLSYEKVRDTLSAEGSAYGRALATLFEHGIVQHRRGRTAVEPCPVRTEFFAAFARAAEAYGFPVVPPKPRAPGAGFLWYPKAATLSQPVFTGHGPNASTGAWIGVKFVDGNVDIELTGLRDHVDRDGLERAVVDLDGAWVEERARSLAVRLPGPALDVDAPIEAQEDAVRSSIERMVVLRDWWEREGRLAVER